MQVAVGRIRKVAGEKPRPPPLNDSPLTLYNNLLYPIMVPRWSEKETIIIERINSLPESCLQLCFYCLFYNFIQLHQEKECPAYPVVCEKCNKDGIPRAKVQLQQCIEDCDVACFLFSRIVVTALNLCHLKQMKERHL